MIGSGSGNWTAIAVNEVLSILFMESGGAAEFFENVECRINSLLARFASQLAQMFVRHFPACGAHPGAEISWLNMAGEYRHEKRDQSPVCFRI